MPNYFKQVGKFFTRCPVTFIALCIAPFLLTYTFAHNHEVQSQYRNFIILFSVSITIFPLTFLTISSYSTFTSRQLIENYNEKSHLEALELLCMKIRESRSCAETLLTHKNIKEVQFRIIKTTYEEAQLNRLQTTDKYWDAAEQNCYYAKTDGNNEKITSARNNELHEKPKNIIRHKYVSSSQAKQIAGGYYPSLNKELSELPLSFRHKIWMKQYVKLPK